MMWEQDMTLYEREERETVRGGGGGEQMRRVVHMGYRGLVGRKNKLLVSQFYC